MSRWAASPPNSGIRMSNTGSLKRTDLRDFAAAFDARRAATILAAVILTTVIVSFRPFQPESAATGDGGDIVNQLGFSTLGGLALFSMFTFVDRKILSALLSPWWLILLGFLALS